MDFVDTVHLTVCTIGQAAIAVVQTRGIARPWLWLRCEFVTSQRSKTKKKKEEEKLTARIEG